MIMQDAQSVDFVMDYLRGRGLTDEVIKEAGLKWEQYGHAIAIPVEMDDGRIRHKYRADPRVPPVRSKYFCDQGLSATLYCKKDLDGAVLAVVTEGEFDTLRIKSDGTTAVSGTTGASSWQHTWSPLFTGKVVVVWYDSDAAGYAGAPKAAESIAHYAKEVWVAHHDAEYGKDITEFLTRTNQRFTPELLRSDPRITLVRARPSEKKPAERKVFESTGEKPNIEAVLQHYGVALQRKGVKMMCPMHDGNSPALSVDTEKGLWKCFGGCDTGGDAYSFVMKMEDCDFKEAKKIIETLLR